MNWIVVFSCILAGELEDNFGAARMRGKEVSDIVDIAVQNNPTAVWGIVLRDCGELASCISRRNSFAEKEESTYPPRRRTTLPSLLYPSRSLNASHTMQKQNDRNQAIAKLYITVLHLN